MAPDSFPLYQHSEVLLAVGAACLFAHLDDHRRLASHMEKPSMMTAGASMRIDTDERHGQAVGSVIRMTGRVLSRLGPHRTGSVREGDRHDTRRERSCARERAVLGITQQAARRAVRS